MTVEKKDSLKLHRVRAGLTQTDLANLAGVTKNTISKMETGYAPLRNSSYDTLEKLAKALNIEVSDLDLGE